MKVILNQRDGVQKESAFQADLDVVTVHLGKASLSTGVHGQSEGMLANQGIEGKEPYALDEGMHPPGQQNKIFVGGMSWDTTDAAFAALFAKFGTVVEATVMRDRINGASRGFGFVTFKEPEAVEAALKGPLMLDDRKIDCKIALPKTGPHGGQHVRKIFVGGILPSTNAENLREHFGEYGNIVNTVVMIDHATGRSRGFGFVTFDNEESVARVLEKTQVVGGKLVECRKALSKQRQMRLQKESRQRHSSRDNYHHHANQGGGAYYTNINHHANISSAANAGMAYNPLWDQNSPGPFGDPRMPYTTTASELFPLSPVANGPGSPIPASQIGARHMQQQMAARPMQQQQMQYMANGVPPNLYSFPNRAAYNPLSPTTIHITGPGIGTLDSPSPAQELYSRYAEQAQVTLQNGAMYDHVASMVSMLGSPIGLSPRGEIHVQATGFPAAALSPSPQQTTPQTRNQQSGGVFRFPPRR